MKKTSDFLIENPLIGDADPESQRPPLIELMATFTHRVNELRKVKHELRVPLDKISNFGEGEVKNAPDAQEVDTTSFITDFELNLEQFGSELSELRELVNHLNSLI